MSLTPSQQALKEEAPHFLDKPVLRGLFWFIVLPYRARSWMASKETDHG